MIPTAADVESMANDFTIVSEASKPTRTYYMRMSEDENRVRNYVDGKNAMRQLIFKTLQTERYEHPSIYSDNFGVEFHELIGKSAVYAVPEIERRIREALTWDNRVVDVTDFEFEVNKSNILVKFTAHTIYGDVAIENVQVGI